MVRSIIGIIPAVDITEDGQPVDPGFIFSAETPQITVVAQAGEVTGSPMDLTWFQVTEAGEEELFTHTVEVASFEAAYSVGTNLGTLASGTYRVQATLEGESLSTTFEVEAPEGESAVASRVGARPAAGGATGQGATSGPPASGGSGTVETPASDPVQSGEALAVAILVGSPVDWDPPGITLIVRTILPGGNGYVEAQATMGGNTRSVSYALVAGVERFADEFDFNPCVHPGGSDLPDTQAEFIVSVFEGDFAAASALDYVLTTLGPDESKPVVTIDSEPPNKSRVERGDEIVFNATAQEDREGPTWQEGLNTFKLIAKPGGQVGEMQQSDAGSPQPCDRKQWNLRSQATYTVPDDAKGVIKICGEALDFAGNFSDPRACNEYYVGEVWRGPLKGRAVIPGCDPNPVPITGQLEAVVASDGTVTGTVREVRASFSCQGGPPSGVLDRKNSFTGTKTADAFVLDLYGVTVTMPIAGTHATGKSDHPGGGGSGVFYNYTLDCVNCAP